MIGVQDAVVVGYGPVGATMANLLGQRGWRVTVLERSDEIYDKPRAITADHEAMRVFQAIGLADQIAATTIPHPGTDFLGMDGDLIKRFYPEPPPHRLGWEPNFMFFQPELESILRSGVVRFDDVQVWSSHEVVRVEQRSDRAVVHAVDCRSGTDVEIHARYVLACDGARSLVRKQVSLGIEDLGFDETWIVVDCELIGDADLPNHCVQYCRPSRPGTYIVGPKQLRRWEIKLLPHESPAEFSQPAPVRRVLSEFVDVTAVEIRRIATYRFHALVADRWRDARVFLVGDAAHQMPPFLGQGLCAGIRDAVNLAWKLDAVERLSASPAILDSYEIERRPHVRTVVEHAKSFGKIIGELDPERAAARDLAARAEAAGAAAARPRQGYIPDLTGGMIAVDEAGRATPGAGELFPQPLVVASGDEQVLLDDLLGPGFALVVDAEAARWDDVDDLTELTWPGRLRRITVVHRRDLPAPHDAVVEREPLVGQWLSRLEAHAAVVRPDRYVYGVARTPHELGEIVASLAAFAQAQPSYT